MSDYGFQDTGIDFLAPRRIALLADEMGLGKSRQAILAAKAAGARKIVVVCPASAVITWEREFEKWWPYEAANPGFNRLVSAISFNKAGTPGIHQQVKRINPDVLIIDEAHFLKSNDAQRSKAIYGKDGMIHHVGRTWALSGTPTPNNPGELWNLTYVAGLHKMTYVKFMEHYCIQQWRPPPIGPKVLGTQNLDELRDMLKGFMLRRTKAEVLPELPAIQYEQVFLEADPNNELTQMAWYGEEPTSTQRRITGMAKVGPAIEFLRDKLDSGQKKIVVFAHHRDVLYGLSRGLVGDYGFTMLHGETSSSSRQAAVDTFQENPDCRVFLGQIDAAGTNLTLTASDMAVMVESSWVPDDNEQCIARVHRIGQTRGVRAIFLSLAGTIDEPITRTNMRKSKMKADLYTENEEMFT